MADAAEAMHEYCLELIGLDGLTPVDGVVWAVAHRSFSSITPQKLQSLCGKGPGRGIIMDVKSILHREDVERAGLDCWSL